MRFSLLNVITQAWGTNKSRELRKEKTQLETVANAKEERNYTKQPREVGDIDRQSNELQAG